MTLSLVGRRQDRKPCPYCHMLSPILESSMLTGAWYCTSCGLRGPYNDETGHKWDSLPREPIETNCG
jgi:ribosomal protein L37AE/L43A